MRSTRSKIRADWSTAPRHCGYAATREEGLAAVAEWERRLSAGMVGEVIGVTDAVAYRDTIVRRHALGGAIWTSRMVWCKDGQPVDETELMDLYRQTVAYRRGR